MRAAIFLAVLVAVLYATAGITYIRDGVLWVLMVYLVIGSVTGGVRRVVAHFTGKDIYYRRSGLSHSWYALTMWLLQSIFGLTPKKGRHHGNEQEP